MKDAKIVNPVLYNHVVQIAVAPKYVIMCFVIKTIYHSVIQTAVNIVTKICHHIFHQSKDMTFVISLAVVLKDCFRMIETIVVMISSNWYIG